MDNLLPIYTTDAPPDMPDAVAASAWIVWAHSDTMSKNHMGTAIKSLSDYAKSQDAHAILGLKIAPYSEYGYVMVTGTAVIWAT
ncbi:hypothetical protein [Nonomuraea sp. NPDC002799]